jgi:hypothetical protein
MTYTFKLSRRLAVSRRYAMLAAAAVLVGCDSETTAPEPDLHPASPLGRVQVVPSRVTAETNQLIHFRAVRQSPRGERHELPLTWHASGGSIDVSGIFKAAEPGIYKVIGKGRGRQKPDTSIVVVVPPQPNIVAVSVSPDTTTLGPGGSASFAVVGVLSDGTTVAVGADWRATGGAVDAAGVYTAGTTAGSYQVIAANTDGTLADTATVTITAPPPPPPAPTIDQVILSPGALSLGTGTTARLAAYGRNSLGDSVVVEVTYSATGGSISSDGLYTAGQTGGSFRVIASAGSLADTTPVTLTAPPPPPSPPGGIRQGIPFGASQLWSSLGEPVTDAFTQSGEDATTASLIIDRINAARTRKVKLLLAMTGGSHLQYMSVINGVNRFDFAKWRAKMDTYNTPAIRQAVADGIRDGTILGNAVMDEPHVDGTGTDGNTWGPAGTMTKVRVDSLCAYVRDMFPTLPVGPVHQHQLFEPTKSYRVCDFLVDQYVNRLGTPESFRDGALAMARRDGMMIFFGVNLINGGIQDKDGTWDCKDQGGIKGQTAPNCQMTPTQIEAWAKVLGPAGCAFRMWRWDDTRLATYGPAFRNIAADFATRSAPGCGRPQS